MLGSAGKRAPPQPGNRAVEAPHTELKRDPHALGRSPVGVVQMDRDPRGVRPFVGLVECLKGRREHPAEGRSGACTDGVAQVDFFDTEIGKPGRDSRGCEGLDRPLERARDDARDIAADLQPVRVRTADDRDEAFEHLGD